LGLLLEVWSRDWRQAGGLSLGLTLGVAAGGLSVALCFGQALSVLNVERNEELARVIGRDPAQVSAILRAAQGSLPLLLAGVGILVTLLLVLMANETLDSRRQARASEIAAAKLAREVAERQRAQASLDRFFTLCAPAVHPGL
jgi:hypothetical protein